MSSNKRTAKTKIILFDETLFLINKNRDKNANETKKNDLQASLESINALSNCRASTGQPFEARTESFTPTKSKNILGAKEKSKVIPPVTKKAFFKDFIFDNLLASEKIKLLKAKKANSGKVNSATINIIETALNLLYPGKKSKNSSVKGMKFLPQARKIDKIVRVKIQYLNFPFNKKRERRNKKITIAPAYVGPETIG